LPTGEGRILAGALCELLEKVAECSGRALRLAVEGTSVKAGRKAAWLENALDFVVTRIGPGCTTVALEAPVLADVLGEELAQAEMFGGRQEAADTAISLFARSLRDTTAENLESEFYDAGVLKAILQFRHFFHKSATSIELRSPSRPAEDLTFGAPELEKVERLRQRIPAPRAFVISGKLDSIRHTDRRFWLELPDGQRIPGRVDEELVSAESLRDLWGHKATIKGVLHFRPSGRVQLLEAQTLAPAESGDDIFAVSPRLEETPLLFETHRIGESAIAQVRGQWPGDESIQDLLEALRDE
jgi:hypothetical protein